ncbi:MAG: type II toxin-antitoxin system RelE/ParE family toxin [Acidobacteriota bacterium]
MDYQVVWSPRVLEDVNAIAAYISLDSSSYALSVVKKILDTTYSLNRLPYSGRIVLEFNDETIPERFAYSYRIIYRVQENKITIAAIIHSKRLLKADINP